MSQFYWPDAPNQLAKWCHRFTRNSLLVDTEIAILNLFPSENLPQFSYHDSVDFSLKKKKTDFYEGVFHIYIYTRNCILQILYGESSFSWANKDGPHWAHLDTVGPDVSGPNWDSVNWMAIAKRRRISFAFLARPYAPVACNVLAEPRFCRREMEMLCPRSVIITSRFHSRSFRLRRNLRAYPIGARSFSCSNRRSPFRTVSSKRSDFQGVLIISD